MQAIIEKLATRVKAVQVFLTHLKQAIIVDDVTQAINKTKFDYALLKTESVAKPGDKGVK